MSRDPMDTETKEAARCSHGARIDGACAYCMAEEALKPASHTELLDEAARSLSMLERHIHRADELLGRDSQRRYLVLSIVDWANVRSRLSSALGEVDTLRLSLIERAHTPEEEQ